MADQTTLPTCTVGSLGGPKIDRRAAIDPMKDDSAAEIMLRNACIEELFRRIGLSDGSTPGSFEQRIAALDLMDPKVHFRADDFDNWTAVASPGWDNGAGADPWTILNGPRRGIGAPFASTCLANTPSIYLVDHEPEVRCLVHVDAWDSLLGSEFVLALRDSYSDNVIAGIRIYDYGTEGTPPLVNRRIQGVVGDGLGGVTATDICAFANDTHYALRFRLDLVSPGVAKLYVSVDGAAEVDCGTAPTPTGPHCYLSAAGPHVAAGSGTFHIHQVRRRANWDPDIDP